MVFVLCYITAFWEGIVSFVVLNKNFKNTFVWKKVKRGPVYWTKKVCREVQADRCSQALTFLFGVMWSIVSCDNPLGGFNMTCRLWVEKWIKNGVKNHKTILRNSLPHWSGERWTFWSCSYWNRILWQKWGFFLPDFLFFLSTIFSGSIDFSYIISSYEEKFSHELKSICIWSEIQDMVWV